MDEPALLSKADYEDYEGAEEEEANGKCVESCKYVQDVCAILRVFTPVLNEKVSDNLRCRNTNGRKHSNNSIF
jgi:hypothetical protein